MPVISPTEIAASDFILPEPLDLRFEGFGDDAFDVLDALRCHPHIDEYRKQKERIRAAVQAPFKRYRDDLVVNWLLPNRIDLETERHVFSRILKNDFGAGGCHHHMWMSFYRPGKRRLRDVQLAHSIWPHGFRVSLYVGRPVPRLFKRVRRRILDRPSAFLALLNPLLQEEITTFHLTYGHKSQPSVVETPLEALPDGFSNAKGIAIRREVPRENVVEGGSQLVGVALHSVFALWPLYRYFLESDEGPA